MDKVKIEIIIGCMFSGKSDELQRRISRYKAIDISCLIINHDLDERTTNYSKTHSDKLMSAVKTTKLLDLINTSEFINSNVIGIDEAQFFSDLYDFIIHCEKSGKSVIISGLDGDSDRKPFGEIFRCIPLCDSIIKLKALDMIDKNGSNAIFTKRISTDTQQISIGSSEKYIVVNRKNYLTSSPPLSV